MLHLFMIIGLTYKNKKFILREHDNVTFTAPLKEIVIDDSIITNPISIKDVMSSHRGG